MGAPADPLILSQRSRIVRFAVEHRIPAMYEFREFLKGGARRSSSRGTPYVWDYLVGPISRSSWSLQGYQKKMAEGLRCPVPGI